jgi:hypothetical protein
MAVAQPEISSIVSALVLLVESAARNAAFWVGACLPAHDLVHDLIGFVIGQVLFMNNIQVCAKEIVNNEIIFV